MILMLYVDSLVLPFSHESPDLLSLLIESKAVSFLVSPVNKPGVCYIRSL